MFTMQGVIIRNKNINDAIPGLNKTTLDLRDLPNGVYMLTVVCSDGQQIVKVVVNR